MYFYPLALGAVLFGFGGLLWSYKKLHRISAWLLGAGAFILTVAIPAWRDALAGLVQTGPSLIILTGLTVAVLLAFVFEAIMKHKHHRIRTPIVSITLGVLAVLAIADAGAMLASFGASAGKTGVALSAAVDHIQSGKAAHSLSADHRYAVIALGVGIVGALAFAGVRLDKKKPGGGSRPLALPGGRPGGGLRMPAGRPPVRR